MGKVGERDRNGAREGVLAEAEFLEEGEAGGEVVGDGAREAVVGEAELNDPQGVGGGGAKDAVLGAGGRGGGKIPSDEGI